MFQPDTLKGRRVLITGGGTGLGKAMGRRCLELGAEVVICGRRESVLTETQAEFDAAFPGRTAWRACDIREADQVEAMLDDLFAQAPVDSVVNNAAGNFLARSETLSPRAFEAVTRIVMNGTAYVSLGLGRRWIESGIAGAAVSIVTTYARTGSPYVLPSACGKAAVEALTKSLAVEWGPHSIRFNAVAPGPFPTEGAWSRLVPERDLEDAWRQRVPLGRFGRHEELGDLVAFLLSGHAGFINGDTITIDGGEWLKGAAQFSFAEQLTESEWAVMTARGKKA